jgi:phage baseplate assembly protein V
MASGEISQEVIHAEPYGMTATPLPEAVGLVLCMSGERDSAVIAQASDPRYRPQGLPPGDVCLYTHQDDRTATAEEAQHRLQFTADRTVVLTAKRLKIICGSQTLVMDEDKIRLEGAMIELQA